MNEKLKKVLESYCIGRYGPASIEEKNPGLLTGLTLQWACLDLIALTQRSER